MLTGRPDSGKNVYFCMQDILQQLVEEAHQLPKEVINLIMENITRKTKVLDAVCNNQVLIKQSANAARHKMAAELCASTADKLQRYICQVR